MEQKFATHPVQFYAKRASRRVAPTALAAALLCFGLAACVVEPVQPEIVRVAPPPPQVEVVPVARPGYVWDAGHWVWHQGRYVWEAGHWQPVRAGYHWVPGHWAERGGGWAWIEGHWVP